MPHPHLHISKATTYVGNIKSRATKIKEKCCHLDHLKKTSFDLDHRINVSICNCFSQALNILLLKFDGV